MCTNYHKSIISDSNNAQVRSSLLCFESVSITECTRVKELQLRKLVQNIETTTAVHVIINHSTTNDSSFNKFNLPVYATEAKGFQTRYLAITKTTCSASCKRLDRNSFSKHVLFVQDVETKNL